MATSLRETLSNTTAPCKIVHDSADRSHSPIPPIADHLEVRQLRQVGHRPLGDPFCSGGQSAESATEHLNAMNCMGPHPWEVAFSYARALQDPALKAWKGEAANVAAAQKIFYHRAKMNSAARSGKYTKQMEAAAA